MRQIMFVSLNLHRTLASTRRPRSSATGPARESPHPPERAGGPLPPRECQSLAHPIVLCSALQKRMRKGSGAIEPLLRISQQQPPDKIDCAEDCRVRAGRPCTVQVLGPKVLRGGLGQNYFIGRFRHPRDLVSRENLQQNPADGPHIPRKKLCALHCALASGKRKLWPGEGVCAGIFTISKLARKKRYQRSWIDRNGCQWRWICRRRALHGPHSRSSGRLKHSCCPS